jgi:hypothetical protein
MIEQFFKKGVRLKWPKPGDRGCPVDGASVLYNTPPNPMIYDGLDNTLLNNDFNANLPGTIGLTMKQSIQYSWLDYAPGRTAKFQAGNKDVLTGLMSGCWLVRWMDKGVTYVAHVGTINSKVADDKVKKTFAAEIANNMTATGFNPAAAWTMNDQVSLIQEQTQGSIKAKVPQGRPGTFGLITPTGQFFSIFMFMVANGEWVVAGCKPVAATAHAQLSNTLRVI